MSEVVKTRKVAHSGALDGLQLFGRGCQRRTALSKRVLKGQFLDSPVGQRIRASCAGTGCGDVVVVNTGRVERAVEAAGAVDVATSEIRRRGGAVVVWRTGHARGAVVETAGVGQVASLELEEVRGWCGNGNIAQWGNLIGGKEGRGGFREAWFDRCPRA